MGRRDSGYATIAATALMASLSLVAIGYTNLSVAKSRQLEAATQSVLNDIMVEAWMLNQVTIWAERREPLKNTGVWHQADLSNSKVEYLITDEHQKLNLQTDRLDAIEGVLQSVLSSSETRLVLDRIKKLRVGNTGGVHTLRDILSEPITPRQRVCLSDNLTLMHAQRSLVDQNAEAFVHDGSIVRVRARTINQSSPRSLDIAVLFTGDRASPFWVLDWSSGPASDIVECSSHA
ncbi:MAG: hypothetical protein AAFY34_09795 [Pseudomonadota bacterium]